MCGIAGLLNFDGSPAGERELRAMAQAMVHRGPDDEGVWYRGQAGLSHRRLAIIDLTPGGHQPMADESATAVVSYSGEIYNHRELRRELEDLGHSFRSRSDTEVIVHAYLEWGEAAVSRFNGHFAIAIWDAGDGSMLLVRDRFGTKPLYYLRESSRLLFGSEIKAILAATRRRPGVDLGALNEYFTFQNVLSDRTLFAGVRLLPAGSMLRVSADGRSEQRRWWDYRFSTAPLDIGAEEAASRLYELFAQAVRRQLISDVPVGSYLSGGMDSGSITAVARAGLGRMRTFTGGFDLSSASGLELGFDERRQSEALANLLKTEHYEMVMHAGDMEAVMPELVWHLEDLRIGQSYPNYYMAGLASRFVKVVLSGAGGDELFGGYPWRYFRSFGSQDIEDFARSYYDFWQRLVPDEQKSALFKPGVYRQLGEESPFGIFRDLVTESGIEIRSNADCVDACLYFELRTFLHGLLVVEDKISFAHGMETRAPFLDNDLVDFALQLPVGMKLRKLDRMDGGIDEDDVLKLRRYEYQSGDGKMVLRRAMSRVIPEDFTSRTKQGFAAPDASWFRGESIAYINGLLRDPKARIYDFLEPGYVACRLDEHTSGRVNNRLFIWSLLSFEWWLRKFVI